MACETICGGRWGYLEGAIFFCSSAALGYFTYTSYQSKVSTLDAYNKLPAGTSRATFDKKWNAAQKANTRFNIFAISLATTWILNIADAYWSGSRIEVGETSSVGQYIQSGFNIACNNDTHQTYFGASYTFVF